MSSCFKKRIPKKQIPLNMISKVAVPIMGAAIFVIQKPYL